MTRRLLSIARDRRGVTAVEFGIVVPVLATLLLGLCDLLYQSYVHAVLEGAVVKAGRDSALEGNALDQADIDTNVRRMVATLGPNMKFTATRRSYATFALVKPETFDDKNKNGVREPGECYDDVNGNKKWDADPGAANQGGANDVTKYTVSVSYVRLFPVSALFGWSPRKTVSATTLLKNQPYRTQAAATIASICNP